MKSKILNFAGAALAALFGATAHAAPTPTAVWEAGEFEKTKNGYSIVLNGNSIDAGGRIAIDSSAGSNLGAYIDVSSAGSKKATVLIKYSNLQPLATSNRSLTSMYLEWSPQSADVGARTKSANTLPITGFTSGNSNTYDFTEEENVPSFVAGTGHIILAIDSDTGTSCYTGSTLDSMVGGTNTGLKYGSYTIRKIAVGGANTATKAYSWDGVKIEKVAIFIGETYTNDELSDYEWPNAQTPVLGDGITAYYDCETHTDSGTTVTVTGKKWDGSTLIDPGNLSLQWNCNDGAGIGTPSTSKFGLCYSGGGTGGRCWESSTCDGLLPGTSAGDWSFSFWLCGNIGNQFVNTPGEGDNQGFRITKDGSNHIVVAVSETTDGTTFNTVSITSDASYTFDSSHWHNVIVVRSGNTLTLYVDGTEAGTATMAAGSYLVNASNTLTMADSSSGGIGQGNGSDEYCVWNRALSFKEVLAITAGTSTVGAMAETIPTLVSLEETGGYVKTATQIAFKNTTLDEITASTLKGRFGGESAGDEKGTEATFCCFATSSEGVKTCEAQISSGEYIKAVLLAFEQVGDDVTVTARGACYKTGGTLGQSVEADKTADSVLSTSPTVAGYGLYNLRLPRTPETSATVVWETGEFEMAKVGPDGYEYSFSSFGGLSVNGDGNLVVDTANAQGAIINMPDTSKKAVSVLIKYSNLAAESGSYATLANCAVNSGNTTYYLGARTITSGTLPLTAYYAGSTYPFDNATYGHGNVPSMDTGSGYFLFAHGSSNGTYAYSGETIGTLDGGYNTQLKWGDYKITKVSIGGGFENDRAYCWKGNGTVIERVAIFLGSIKTPGDLSDYYFPSAEKYRKYSYAGDNLWTWKTPSTVTADDNMANNSVRYSVFDLSSGVDTDQEYTGGNSTDGLAYWTHFCYSAVIAEGNRRYTAPGRVLRFVKSDGYRTANINGKFSPLTLGGIIVEDGATGYSIQNPSGDTAARSLALGDPTGTAETWFEFNEDFTLNRTSTNAFMGTLNFYVANGKTLTIPKATTLAKTWDANALGGNGYPTIATIGGALKMHGEGHIDFTAGLTAEGSTLDFSDAGNRTNDATPFINGPLTINGDTKFVFPADITLPYTYKVATSITVNGDDNPTYEYTDASGSVFTFEPVIDTENGTVTIPALSEAKSASLNLGTTRGTFAFLPELAELTISATELLSEDGLFSLVIGEGLNANVIDLILTNQNGEEVTTDVTYSGDTLTATYAPTVSGKACWIDYEMTYVSGDSNKTGFENSGTDTTNLSSDSGITGDNAFNQDTGMLYTYAHPWRNMTGVNAYPASWTAVVRCTVPAYENAAIITFGTCSGGLIGLVAGHDPETQMKLVKTTGNSAFTVLSEMTVQNATTAQHVYVFSVEDNQTIKIYCDGEPVLNETYDAFTLGGGIQVGSVHGGVHSTGIVRFAKGESPANTLSETVQKAARIDCVRLFKTVLGPKAIEQLSVEFPAMKLYKATVPAGASKAWDELGWTPAWDGGNECSKIILTAAGAATVTMPEKITAEDFTINAADGTTLSLVGDNTILAITNPIEVNGGAVRLSGTMEANVEITGELAVEGLTLTGTGTLTLDGIITATGAVELQDTASIAIKSGATINVASGLFTAAATAFALGPKTMATDNEDGTYTFEVAKAQIGEIRYNTIEAAIAAFTDHNTVLTILDDTYEHVSLEAQGIFWDEATRTYSYAAASVGTTYLQTLAEALAAASVGEDKTVTLFKNNNDGTLVIPAGVALRLNGYTIAATPTTVDGYVIGITEGDTVYTAITNDASEWVGDESGNWNLYSNWSTGAVPGANTVVTIPAGTYTIGISEYGSSAYKFASMIANGTATFTCLDDETVYPELTLYGDISGSGKIIIRRAGLRNVSGGLVTISCALGVEYNSTKDDSFLRGDNGFEITGDITVSGFLKIDENVAANATGVTTLENGSIIQASNGATLAIAELISDNGVAATVKALGTGTLTVAEMTGEGNVTVTNCTITLLDNYTGTLGGTLNIGTVNKTTIDPDVVVVNLASGCTVNNLAETMVTENGNPTDYRLYAKEGGLYVKTALEIFRSTATGGWLDANSWTNAQGDVVAWTTENLIYANIDAEQIESIGIEAGESVEMAKLTITGGATSSLTLGIDGTIAIDQEWDLGGMSGTIVKDGAGALTAKGDNSDAALNWTIEAGTLSLGGEFDSIGGNGTVVTMNGGTLDIAGAHGGSTVKKLVMNGDGAVFTNSAAVNELYVYNHTFPFPQIEVNADGIVCSDIDGDNNLEWGAIAASGEAWITIAEGKTLTKTGAGKFYIKDMAITGEGTLRVLEGVLDKGGVCTVDNLEIENWSNIAGGGSITVNNLLAVNNVENATVQLAGRSMHIADNATIELKNAGTLDVGTWRENNFALKVPEAGGKIQLTLSGNDELEIPLNVIGLDESDIANVILKDSGGNDVSGIYTVTRSGDTIRIVRTVTCMVVNPVTGEHVAVNNAFTGATDATWETTSNWQSAQNDYSAWEDFSGSYAPALDNSNTWTPVLLDGDMIAVAENKSVTVSALNGWAIKIAALNGVDVAVGTLGKLQADATGAPMWMMVDENSSITIDALGGSNENTRGTLKYFVVAQDGVTYNDAFNKTNVVEYYLSGDGSVNYAAGVSAGTHIIRRATIESGTGEYKTLVRKALVKYSTSTVSFDTDDLEVTGDGETPVRQFGALIGTEDFGTYAVIEVSNGVYIEYIGHSATAPVEYYITGSGNKTWSWSGTAPGASDTVIVKLTGDMTLDLGDTDIEIGRLLVMMDESVTGTSATLTLSGAKLTAGIIIIDEPAGVVAGKADQLAGLMQGGGTVKYPVNTKPADVIWTDAGWMGTLVLTNLTTGGYVPFETYGNSNSSIKAPGFAGYTTMDTAKVCTATLIVDAGTTFTLNNGNSNNGFTFAKLKGEGTIVLSGATGATTQYVFRDVSEFSGVVTVNNEGYKSLVFGADSTWAFDCNNFRKKLVIAGGEATIASGKTWTATGGIVNNGTLYLNGSISGAITGSGTIVKTGSGASLLNGSLENFTGQILVNAGTLVFADAKKIGASMIEFAEGTTLGLVDSIANDGSVTIDRNVVVWDDATTSVKLYNEDMTASSSTVTAVDNGDGTWTYSWAQQSTAWYDFDLSAENYDENWTYGSTHSNMIWNRGSAGSDGDLSNDGFTIGQELNPDTGGLYTRTHPYRSITYPSEWSAVVYATLPALEDNVLVMFGSAGGGFLALIRGSTENEIKLVWGKSSEQSYTTLAAMKVKAATIAHHLVVFSKNSSYVNVYIDGVHVVQYPASGLSIGSGFQVGSIFNGDKTNGLTRPASDDPSEIALIRIYDQEIGERFIASLADKYHEDLGYTSTRTLDSDTGKNGWYVPAGGVWSNRIKGEAVEDDGSLPLENADVTITSGGDCAQWLSIILNADNGQTENAVVGDLVFTGTQPVTLHKSYGGNCVDVCGVISNEVDLTIHVGALDMTASAIKMTDSATLHFDPTDYLTGLRTAGRVNLTGDCDEFLDSTDNPRVTCYPTSNEGIIRFKSFGYDSSKRCYYMVTEAARDPKNVYIKTYGDGVVDGDTQVYYNDGDDVIYTLPIDGDTLYFTADSAPTNTISPSLVVGGLSIPAGITLVMSNEFAVAVYGEGNIIIDGARPKASESAASTALQDSAKWKGTLEIRGVNFGNTHLGNFGNANSVLRLIGCSITPGSSDLSSINLELEDGDYGYGLKYNHASGSGIVTSIGSLAGSGTFLSPGTDTAEHVGTFRVVDASNFAGTIENAAPETAAGGLFFLVGSSSATPAEGMLIAPGGELRLVESLYASTNLTVNGTIEIGEAQVPVVADAIAFDGGTLILRDGCYPYFAGPVSVGTGGMSVEFPDGIGSGSIQLLRASDSGCLPAKDKITLVGPAAAYIIVTDNDGNGYSLVRGGFYLRIR